MKKILRFVACTNAEFDKKTVQENCYPRCLFVSARDGKKYEFQDTSLYALACAMHVTLIFSRGFEQNADLMRYSVATAVLMDKDSSAECDVYFEEEDAHAAFQNMMLSADAVATYMQFYPYMHDKKGKVDYMEADAADAVLALSMFIRRVTERLPDKAAQKKALEAYCTGQGEECGKALIAKLDEGFSQDIEEDKLRLERKRQELMKRLSDMMDFDDDSDGDDSD